MAAEAGEPEGVNLLAIMGRAEQLSKDYQSRTIEKPLNRAYKAWQNQHAEGSKYLGTAWRGRSRLFVPKTRSAVRKNLATAAAALFSTEDVVNVTADYEDDDKARATAAVMKADLDYRLTRSSTKSGIPWYQIAMGGCLDGQLTGVTLSKQFWDYEEVPTGEFEEALVPLSDEETGEDILDPETGEPVMVPGEVPKMRVVRDRPMIELHPIENAGLDPAAPWYAPAQLGRWFYMDYPMGLSDVKAMLASAGKNGSDKGWLPNVSDDLLSKGRIQDDRSGSRRTREGGSDRYEDAKAPGDLDIVWIRENFVRIAGVDWHFWSVGRFGYISKVRPVWEGYPEYDGERPYHMGVSQLDTHRVFPMSPVESWQPLQLELNDITNLRQDTLKRAIAPLAVVKRGKNVDMTALSRRGQPEATLLVDDPAQDVVFTATPGPTGAAYTETSVNNAMFDELAGVFSTSSVQSNRQLNETVGGMKLMTGAANAVSEFDLRMWVETWVEPVLRQQMHLIRYWESDARLIAIAGQKARVWKEFGYMPDLNDFESTEVTLRVNAGIGALDPMQKLSKLRLAGEMLMPMFPQMEAQGIKPKIEVWIEEVMGQAGFKDGRRFFEFGEPAEQQPPPEMMQAMEELKLEREKMQAQAGLEREKMQMSLKEVMLELRSQEIRDREDNQTALEIENKRGKREVLKQVVGTLASRESRAHDVQATREGRMADMHTSQMDRMANRQDTREARDADAAAARRQRVHEILAGSMKSGSRGQGSGVRSPSFP